LAFTASAISFGSVILSRCVGCIGVGYDEKDRVFILLGTPKEARRTELEKL